VTRILVLGGGHGLAAWALIALARAADDAAVVLKVAGDAFQTEFDALQLERRPTFDLGDLNLPRGLPVPKFGGDRPYLKRKKGRS
jgi:hypothetical protein